MSGSPGQDSGLASSLAADAPPVRRVEQQGMAMRCKYLGVLLAVVAPAIWAAEPVAQTKNPALVDPYFPSFFVTFTGFGPATPQSEQRIAEAGEPIHQISMTPASGDLVWLKILNNTTWSIAIPTDSMYMNGLKSGMRISIQYVALDPDGKPIPSPYDTGAISQLASGCAVFFAIPREVLKGGRSIRLRFTYAWEPRSQDFSGAAIYHELVIDRDILPPAFRELK